MPISTAATSTTYAASAKALVKGLAIVQSVASATEPSTLKDITPRLELSRTTAQRLLQVLVDAHVLQGDAAAGYTLGPQLASWGARYTANLDVLKVAEPYLKDLSERTRETVYLGVRLGRQVLYIGKQASSQPVQPGAVLGASNPLHSTGIGKALLTWASGPVQSDYLAGHLESRTANTITDPDELRKELDGSAQRGYAIDNIENEADIRCVAAPVIGADGYAVAAISVSAPTYRFSLDNVAEIAPEVVRIAKEVSERCGGCGTR